MKKVPLIIVLVSSLNVSRSQCNPPAQEICMVTADTLLHTYGVVIWEKVVTDEIDSFYIYRKHPTGLYEKIGSTHYSDPGEFWDYGVNLSINYAGLYKYKISTLDTCGNESPLSNYHKPIHLNYGGSGNFYYDDYEIEFQTSNYPFELFMDITGTGNTWQVINSVPPGIFTMPDPAYSTHPWAVYHIRITLPSGCDPTRGINTSRSNIRNQVVNTAIEEFEENLIQVYPNPSSGIIYLDYKPGLVISGITVINTLGQIVLSQGKTEKSLNLTVLDSGVYSLLLSTNAGEVCKTIVLE